jgi:phosphoglycerate dehydrogenase-like enzyme
MNDAPLTVLLGFPPSPPADLVAKLTALSPRLDVIACSYETRRKVEDLTEEQRDAFGRADVVLAFQLPPDMPTVAPNVRWVQAIGAGIDHYKGCGLDGSVTVTNAVGVAAVPIAEFCIARLLGIWKRFDELAEQQTQHEWKACFGRTFAGSTVGVVGLGAIGTAVAERAHALGARVVGMRRNVAAGAPPYIDALFSPDQLPELLASCDAVVLSAPSTAETNDLFDKAAFAAMKPGAVFVNVARGALVDEVALMEALWSGHLGAAALDVAKQEPLPADSPLWDTPRLFLSPHSAASIERYLENLYDLFADNLARYLRGERLRNIVDLEAGY